MLLPTGLLGVSLSKILRGKVYMLPLVRVRYLKTTGSRF